MGLRPRPGERIRFNKWIGEGDQPTSKQWTGTVTGVFRRSGKRIYQILRDHDQVVQELQHVNIVARLPKDGGDDTPKSRGGLVDNLVAIEKASGMDIKFIGFLLWFSVADCRITREQLEEVFSETGIDSKRLPKEISPRDAFRRATSAAEKKRIPLDLKEERFLNCMIREIRADSKQINRQLVREIVDGKNVRLEYTPVADLIHQENGIHLIPKVDLLHDERDVIDEIKDTYEIEKNCYNGRTMRDIINALLWECHPVAVRTSGGVYFVPARYEETTKSIKRFAKRLNDYRSTDHKTTCWTMPLVDAEEQRSMIEESLEDQVASESKAVIDEMAKLTKGERKITQKLANQYVERVKSLKKLYTEYEDMLNYKSVEAQANLDLAMQGAMGILSKVELEAS
ncbi:MAG: hypothetical protein A4E56_00109 [Pelotomaculum sp. PtaU1.Bin065]|nr:MAG: hypothetical protein A4E56_00109 [Pelotomaculum sp. PtaU1.Bin065]